MFTSNEFIYFFWLHSLFTKNSLVNNESNDNFDQSLSNQLQTSEFACLPTESYGSTVGGVLLVGTVQQLHNTLNFLELQAKQQHLLYSSTSGIITSTGDQVRNVSNLPPTTITAYNGNPMNFCHTTSFCPDVSLKLDTIQPWSIPRHLAPLSLNLPINNRC
ncbi:unnamed protein product [Schistosoma curassoni]|uniref:Uncharacterized protein n=1 Tax=Schistosoma curassoni TaxID=6186 RepID=A0A183JTF4_9TREM|nr:unnamed protein product [Schistosoma curassoni]